MKRAISFLLLAAVFLGISSSNPVEVKVIVKSEKDQVVEGQYYNAKFWIVNKHLVKGYKDIRFGYSVPDPNAGEYDWPEREYLERYRVIGDTGYVTLIAPKIPANAKPPMKVKWYASVTMNVGGKDTIFNASKEYYVVKK